MKTPGVQAQNTETAADSKRVTPKKTVRLQVETGGDAEAEGQIPSPEPKRSTPVTPRRDGLRLLQTKSTTGKKAGKRELGKASRGRAVSSPNQDIIDDIEQTIKKQQKAQDLRTLQAGIAKGMADYKK